MKDAYLIGTSNSVLRDGYFSYVSELSAFKIVQDFRVGDVPITNFLSIKNNVKSLSTHCKIDIVIIDSIINDVLMTSSKKLSKENLTVGLEGVASIIRENFGIKTKILLLNFIPDPVKNASTYSWVKELRFSTFERLGLKVSELDIVNANDTNFFNPKDPLHHTTFNGRKIAQLLDSHVLDLERDDYRRTGFPSDQIKKYGAIRLADIPRVRLLNVAICYESSLLQEVTTSITCGYEMQVSLENPTSLIGMSFISSKNSSLVLRIETDNDFLFVPIATRSRAEIYRFAPFPDRISKETTKNIKIQLVKITNLNLEDDKVIKLPNSLLEPDLGEFEKSCKLINFIYTSPYDLDVRKIKLSLLPKLRLCFKYFWSGFSPKNDKIFGVLLRKHFDVYFVEEPSAADIVITSWDVRSPDRNHEYQKLKELTSAKLVYYTAEHDGLGLTGIGQVNFEIFDHVFSHYHIASSKHTWMPNYVRRHGIDVFRDVNEMYRKNINKEKTKNIQFCYSNQANPLRNDFFHSLNKVTPVDANGKLFNTDGNHLPRKHMDYIDALSEYRFVISFENTGSPGYNTEKLVHALMAGSVPLYCGDPFVDVVWNTDCFIQIKDNNKNNLINYVSENGQVLFETFRKRNAIPFPDAENFSKDLEDHYIKVFKNLST